MMLFHRLKVLDQEAQKIGLYWEHVLAILNQIECECQEVLEATSARDSACLKEELGDLLHAITCCALFLALDLSNELESYVEKLDLLEPHSLCLDNQAHISLVQKIIDALSYLQNKIEKSEPNQIGYHPIILDMLYVGCTLVHKSGFLCREVIEGSMKKFQTRLDKLVLLAHAKGIDNLNQLSLQEKLDLWEQVKKME